MWKLYYRNTETWFMYTVGREDRFSRVGQRLVQPLVNRLLSSSLGAAALSKKTVAVGG